MSLPKYNRLDPAQRHEQILEAANHLFAERAYDEVSVEDIAGAAGVTRGLVHHYFGGRREVYIALVERLGAEREERLRPPIGRSARARVADTAKGAVETVAGTASDAGEMVAGAADGVRTHAEDVAGSARQSATAAQRRARLLGRELNGKAADAFNEYPLVVAAGGLLVGTPASSASAS